MIDGKRTYIWSGEFHYYRLPSPDLWRDVLQKMKAAGFNAASIYFDWAYHSPKPGVYDFTGVRDVDKLLDQTRTETDTATWPVPMPSVPSVAMNELTRRRVTISPLTRPKAVPVATP